MSLMLNKLTPMQHELETVRFEELAPGVTCCARFCVAGHSSSTVTKQCTESARGLSALTLATGCAYFSWYAFRFLG